MKKPKSKRKEEQKKFLKRFTDNTRYKKSGDELYKAAMKAGKKKKRKPKKKK